MRRKFFDVHAATGSPIAKEALDRIGQLYRVEEIILGALPDDRRRERQRQSIPIATALRAWAEQTAPKLSRKSELAAAFRYMRARWPALGRCFDDGRLALDNNPAERALRGVAARRSLCPPSLSIWEHWKRIGVSDATRATFSGHRHFDRFRRQIISADLVRRSGNNLLSGKDLGFNEAAQGVVRHA